MFEAETSNKIWGMTSGWRKLQTDFNPLNAELNPICHLLALLGAHPILHVSRIRVKELNNKVRVKVNFSGFGGLEVACWPLVPKFAGLHRRPKPSDF